MRQRQAGPAILVLFSVLGASACGPPKDRDTGRFWPAPEPGAAPKVLLVGWDGVRPDILREVPTPHFDSLAAAGAFSGLAQTGRPTVSGPGWSSMLTGVWPDKHGVQNNDFSSNRYSAFPDFLTRLESLKPELRTFAAADWLPLVAEDAGGPLISDAVDRKVVLDGYELGWLEADSVAVEAAVEDLATADPDALFVYLGAPDEISHETGGIGAEYRASIGASDRLLGRLLDAIRSRPAFAREDWLVLVATDHGRTERGGHGGESLEETTIFYLASGPSALRGPPPLPPRIVDVAVTALAHLGFAPDPGWELDGEVVGIPASSAAAPASAAGGRVAEEGAAAGREALIREPAAEGEPAEGRGARPGGPDTVRILTYNTHHGEGLDRILDMERIAEVIRAADPDVVALQEIDRHAERTGAVDQPARYGALTGLYPLFGDFMRYQGGEYGMALLTRLPIAAWTNLRLPPGAEPRSSVVARLRLPRSGREVVVCDIHFYRTEEERLAQARRLTEFLERDSLPVFLAGDFNSTRGSPVMEHLRSRFAVPRKRGAEPTFPADAPEREIDYVLFAPEAAIRVLDYRVLEEAVASDHRPVLIVLEIS